MSINSCSLANKESNRTERGSHKALSFSLCVLTLSVSLFPTDSVQRADLLLYQHRGSVHPLPR